MWAFRIPDKGDAEVVGFTSMSPSTRAKAYQWAEVLMGEINPKVGWGPEDVEGRRCRLFVGTYKDAQGAEKNKVEKVLKSRIPDDDPETPFKVSINRAGGSSRSPGPGPQPQPWEGELWTP